MHRSPIFGFVWKKNTSQTLINFDHHVPQYLTNIASNWRLMGLVLSQSIAHFWTTPLFHVIPLVKFCCPATGAALVCCDVETDGVTLGGGAAGGAGGARWQEAAAWRRNTSIWKMAEKCHVLPPISRDFNGEKHEVYKSEWEPRCSGFSPIWSMVSTNPNDNRSCSQHCWRSTKCLQFVRGNTIIISTFSQICGHMCHVPSQLQLNTAFRQPRVFKLLGKRTPSKSG